MEKKELRELQLKQLEILEVIHNICDKYSIKYSLYGGSAIGAVRHNGFIPWDDDLDIVMNRREYERFKEICSEELPDNYFFQDYYTDKEFNQTFAKIRDSETTFICAGTEDMNINHGVFVDIFPLDTIPKSKISQIKQFILSCLHLLFTRKFVPQDEGKIKRIISKYILKLIPYQYYDHIRDYCYKEITKYKYEEGFKIDTSLFSTLKLQFDQNILEEVIEIKFENMSAKIFKRWDLYLEKQYGDYMQLPPLIEQVPKHNGIILDINKSYKTYKKGEVYGEKGIYHNGNI